MKIFLNITTSIFYSEDSGNMFFFFLRKFGNSLPKY